MKNNKLLHIFSAPQSVYFFLDKQMQFMKNNGFEVHVVMPDDGFYSEKLLKREPGIQFHFVSLKREISLLHDIKSLITIFFLILKIKPNILHLHTPKAFFIGGLAARMTFQKNIIYQMHGLVSTNGTSVKKNIVYFLEKYTCSLSTIVCAVSPSLAEFAIKNNYCSEEKIRILGNGTINGIDWKNKFNPSFLKSEDKYLSLKRLTNKFVIGYIGRISDEKGIVDFLEVISELKNEIPVVGIIVGRNEMGKEFEKKLIHYELKDSENVIIFDEIHDQEKIMCYFNVLLFPSKREGFGLVAAEANALEIPVVAYNIPGVKDAIENNKTGKLVTYPNIEELKIAVSDYYFNEVLRIQHGKNGWERIKQLFTQEDLWENILKVYKELIN